MTSKLNRQEVVNKRKYLYVTADRYHTFNVGDKRVYTPRICSVCSRPLSRLIINEQAYITSHTHTRFHMGKDVQVNICKDIRSCYRRLKEREELD